MNYLQKTVSLAGITLLMLISLWGTALHGQQPVAPKTVEISITSTADGSKQPAMFYAPKTEKAVPLLVALHTWSFDYKQETQSEYAGWCIKKGWAYIHPDFRGPNVRPEATGSELAVQDVLDAVEYAKKNANIDGKRIYLIGSSGGGHMSLLMAGRAPHIWAGVSAWVPITDLKAWHAECKERNLKYYQDIEKSCGGPPGKSPAADKEYMQRSPLTHLKKAKNLPPLDINAGIHDGHTGSVPVSHSLHAFNVAAEKKDRLAEADISYFVKEAKVPPKLQMPVADPTYGNKKVLFRRSSGTARVTIFDGGHELIAPAGLNWLQQKRKD